MRGGGGVFTVNFRPVETKSFLSSSRAGREGLVRRVEGRLSSAEEGVILPSLNIARAGGLPASRMKQLNLFGQRRAAIRLTRSADKRRDGGHRENC
jgi:hypothetical protein